MHVHFDTGPTRLALVALGAGGLWLSGGCRSDEVQGPTHGVEAPRVPQMAAVPTSGLVGEWKLDETGGTVANDSKNNFDATVFGGAAFITGKIGNALNLNNGTGGTGGKYAQMPSNATLDNVNEGDYTFAAWFQPASIPTNTVSDNRFWAIVVKASPHLGLFYDFQGRFLMRHYYATATGPVGEQAITATSYPVGSCSHAPATAKKPPEQGKVSEKGPSQERASFTAGTAAED